MSEELAMVFKVVLACVGVLGSVICWQALQFSTLFREPPMPPMPSDLGGRDK